MKCSVCDCDFDLESEGGVHGNFGILPVAFCPTCFSCMHDMVSQTCEWCVEREEEEEKGERNGGPY